ncbi:hypothetical protein GC089_08550 [Cellulomonas sp. JZ18]|uniref:hypothetical protein n=1 Tax=Cellulomonas sp. JZ18 TaxID=2654191 RepID=UPI0012D4A870|nr:hypothetical protein [Cellulomonas sp. JZ18]QGQ19271.1 hypothetical protein GC089_08550 [Cellulomonas sp. JZ18]
MVDQDTEAAIADLWRFYEEHAEQARQHETLRASATSVLAGIASAVLAFVGVDGINRSDVPAGLAVVLVSTLGVVLSLKHYERNRMHTAVMKATRDEIETLRRSGGRGRSASAISAKAVAQHDRDFAVLRRRHQARSRVTRARLHLLWAALPGGIGVVGVVVVVAAAWRP